MSKYPATVFVVIPVMAAGVMGFILCSGDFLHHANIFFPF